jgi:nitrile hydratase
MNGVHDLGGMHGMGPINPEPNEPVFHEDWERKVFGLFVTTFAAGCFNVDEFRHEIEKMAPAEYLSSSYYAHWLHAIEGLLARNGTLSEAEIEARMHLLAKEPA